MRPKTTLAGRVDPANLFTPKDVQKGFSGYTVLEGWDDRERAASSSLRAFLSSFKGSANMSWAALLEYPREDMVDGALPDNAAG